MQTDRLAGIKSTSSTLNQSNQDLIERRNVMIKLGAKKEQEQIEKMLKEKGIPEDKWKA